MPPIALLSSLVQAVSALWISPQCLGCGVGMSSQGLCATCSRWQLISDSGCQRCGAFLSFSLENCSYCREWDLSLDKLRSAAILTPQALSLFRKIKFQGEGQLLKLFQCFPRDSLQSLVLPNTLIVPVPLFWWKEMRRGFNQAAVIASWAAKETGCVVDYRSLKKKRNTVPQSSLGRKDRAQNLKKAFAWTSSACPENVLLIDDILTTGATLQACAKVLKQAGAQNVSAWTLFRTPEGNKKGVRNT